MPRLVRPRRGDRLAAIKAATSYPTATQAIAARLAAMTSQTAVRPLAEVPVAEVSPKHLSSAYTRNSIRRVKVSQWLETFRLFIGEQLREMTIPERRPKMNPAYSAIAVCIHDSHRNIGPICTEYQGTTKSSIRVEATEITPKLIARAENILRVIPPDALGPERQAERTWAKWILETPMRIESGRELSYLIAETRQQSQRVAVRNAATNAVQDAKRGFKRDPSAPIIPELSRSQARSQMAFNAVSTNPDTRFLLRYIDLSAIPSPKPIRGDVRIGNTLFLQRKPLSSLVPWGK